MSRELIAAVTEYIETSQKVIAALLEEKGDVAGHEFHGNRWTGGDGSAGKLGSRIAVQRHIDYMGEQNHAARALDLLKTTGGFTYDPAAHHFTNVGDHGFAVSPYKGREAVFTSPITRADLEGYIRKNSDVLGLPGHAVGGWDDEHGKQVLDVSVIAPSKAEALIIAQANDQDAIFDFAAGQSIAAKAADGETKGDAAGHAFHGNRWTGGVGGGGGSGNLPFNAHGDQYFHALSPKGQEFVKAACERFKVTPEHISKEIAGRLTLADGTPNKALLEDGAKWYPMAHELADKIAASTSDAAHPVSMEQVATAMAKLSPQTPWETNAEVASRLSQWVASGKGDGMTSEKAALAFKAEWHANGWGGESITHPGTMNKLAMMNNLVTDAVDVLNGTKTIEQSLQSPKQRSFANNIMLPGQTDDVTVDVMMQKSISFSNPRLPKDPEAADEHGLPRDKTVANFFSAKSVAAAAGPGYVTVAAGTRIAAKSLGYSPDTVQAAYWIAVQDQTPPNWPRSTGATMTQMKTPNVTALLGHPFIGTAGYKSAPSDMWPLDVDYGDMELDDTETMTADEYESAVDDEKAARKAGAKGDASGHEFHGNRWTGGIGGAGAPTAAGNVTGGHGEGFTTHVSTIEDAVRLLGQGRGIMFERPQQAVTLLHELSKIATEAKAAGKEAKVYDLCKVSVADTNLFCSQNVGIPRSAMPQLVGKPLPGTPADSLPKNAKGEVDLSHAFRDSLTASGHSIEDTQELAGRLRASQTEMQGLKVGGMMEAMEAGKIPQAPIFVSSDNYIVDGHHRWAATIGVDYADGKADMKMPVSRVDMKILPLLAAANKFSVSMGIPQSAVTKAFFASLDLKAFGGDDDDDEEDDSEDEESDDKITYEDETDQIRESVASPEAQAQHDFEPAKWTHPNGHPRCRVCGGEERTDGCAGDMVPTEPGALSPSRPKS